MLLTSNFKTWKRFLDVVIKFNFSLLYFQRSLADNETHVQLSNLEKKLSHLEQNNFTIQEFIANKKAELNFEPVRNKVLKMQWEYNKILVEMAKNTNSVWFNQFFLEEKKKINLNIYIFGALHFLQIYKKAVDVFKIAHKIIFSSF